MEIATIIALVTGIASLLGVVYGFAVWRTKVDGELRRLTEMLKTLWDIYIIDALKGRSDLADHHSAFKLRKEGYDMIPDALKEELDQIPVNPTTAEQSDIASGYLVVKHLTIDKISKMAWEAEISVQEAIAILSLYLDEKILRVKSRVEGDLLKRPGVTGVDVGHKYIGGKKTDVLAIRVYVEKKKSKADVSHEDEIPQQVGGIPTDVIERGFILHDRQDF